MSSRKSSKQAVLQMQPSENQLPLPSVAPSSMNITHKFKYVDVGLEEYTQIIFKELNQVAERIRKVQDDLVVMQSKIESLETC